jgi:hypothetical protein
MMNIMTSGWRMWVDNRRIRFDGEKLWLTQDSEVLDQESTIRGLRKLADLLEGRKHALGMFWQDSFFNKALLVEALVWSIAFL